MTAKQQETLRTILQWTRVSKQEARVLLQFTREVIDPKAHFCLHCDGQVRWAWNRVREWAEQNTGKRCIKCGARFEPTHHRNTVCPACKTKQLNNKG